MARLVSIHAPVKGATYPAPEGYYKGKVSIHAPVKGATQAVLPSYAFAPGFNSHSREGSDIDEISEVKEAEVFQFTLP